jgi:hypothetical protein
MSYRKGSKVWVEEKGEGWLEAEVVDAKERAVVVLTSQRKKVPPIPFSQYIPPLSLSPHSVRLKSTLCRFDFLFVDAIANTDGSTGQSGYRLIRARFEFGDCGLV